MIRIFQACVGALFLAAWTVSAAASAPPPVSAYGALPALEEVAISQDGSRIAYISLNGERRALIMQKVTGEPLGAVEVGDSKVRSVEWGGNDHVIITASLTNSAPEWGLRKQEWYYPIAYDLKRKKLWNLAGYIPDTANVANRGMRVLKHKDEWVAILGTFHEYKGFVLRRIPLDGRPSTELQDFHDHMEDFVLDPITQQVIAQARFDQTTDTWTLHARDGAGWPVIHTVKSELDTPDLRGKGRTPGTLMLRTKTTDDYELMEIPMGGGALRPATDDTHDYSGVLRDPVTDEVIGLTYWEHHGNFVFFDPKDSANWSKVRRLFKGNRVQLESWSDDRQKAVVQVEGPTNSGTYYYIDFTTNQVTIVGEAFPQVTAEHVADVQPYEYRAADGRIIPGYLTLPRGREAKDLPLIVFPHGGPQAHDVQAFDWWAQAMASRGYAVLQPNFRGSDGYGTEHLEAGYGQWGRKMQTDLSDGVRALAAEGVIDPSRVCIVGASYGGYAAMAGPTLDPGVYRCAVAVAGVSDLEVMLKWERSEAGAKRDNAANNYWRRFMGVENDSDPSLAEVSPARQIERLNVPVLLIHGRDDTVVPYRQSLLFKQAAEKAGKPVEFITLDGEDHSLSRSATRLRMLEATIAFLERHNPPQ